MSINKSSPSFSFSVDKTIYCRYAQTEVLHNDNDYYFYYIVWRDGKKSHLWSWNCVEREVDQLSTEINNVKSGNEMQLQCDVNSQWDFFALCTLSLRSIEFF